MTERRARPLRLNENAVTRRDVAAAAGVSETIVSYVINNTRYVAPEKRKRVQEAIERLHYRPNTIARALKGKGSSHILFIVGNVSNEYYGSLMQEIDSVAYDAGFLVSLMGFRNTPDFISRILTRQVDAVVISSSAMREESIQKLADTGLAVVVLMTRDYPDLSGNVSRIYTGIESGIMRAVRLLYDKGRRNLVHVDRVSLNGHFSNRQDLRYRGFCNQMEACGLPLYASSFITGCAHYDELYDAVCARVRSGAPVDGFVCRNDPLACTVLSAIRACGLDVPGDISVTGFDDSRMSRVIQPRLTTLAHNQPGMAAAILETIKHMLAGGPPEDRYFQTTLIEREST